MYEIFDELLKRDGISANAFAKLSGIAQSTLSDWKNGKSVPKIDKLEKIADYFGVTVDYLRTGRMPLTEEEALEHYYETLDHIPNYDMKEILKQELLNLVEDDNEEELKRIIEMVKILKK